MSRKRKIVIGTCIVFVSVLTLRELGVIDASLYSRSSSSSRFMSNWGSDVSDRSYRLVIKAGETALYDHTRIITNVFVESAEDVIPNAPPPLIRKDDPVLELTVQLNELAFTCGYWVPLYKRFTMAYSGEYGAGEPWGDINGEMTVRIIGLCSGREARGSALNEMRETVLSYIEQLGGD